MDFLKPPPPLIIDANDLRAEFKTWKQNFLIYLIAIGANTRLEENQKSYHILPKRVKRMVEDQESWTAMGIYAETVMAQKEKAERDRAAIAEMVIRRRRTRRRANYIR
ncbi:hypothetical protein ACJJTC_008183 [Scirpophaga incertulas]